MGNSFHARPLPGRAARSVNLIAVLLFCLVALAGTVRADDFDDANQLYDQGKFGDAKQTYERLAGRGEWSANLFYNLGNADYRIGAPGKAVLNFERALALDGTHTEARANLKWLRGQTGAKAPARRWWEYAYPALPGDVFAIGAVLTTWAAIFGIVAALFGRRFVGWVIFSLLFAIYAGVGVWRSDQERSLAIITAKDAVARLAPADRASLAEPLPEGSRVRVLSERGEWIYCALPGGGRGWVAEGQLEKVRLTKS